MGLLDDMENKAVTSMLGGNSNPLATSILEMLHNHPGGLSGLVQGFQEKGLGNLISSWVGTGQNLPISADQIQHGLGSQQVQEMATKLGISPEVASSQMASILPMLIDKLTPNGQVPQQGNLLEMGMNALRSMGKTGTEG